MRYVRKICPVCGNEFTVLEKMEEKAVYCTLRCFLESQNKMSEDEDSHSLSG
ncbi:hypothetical protein RSJ42_09135 [Methanosarcina hadiensis]|uniref:hypothetical protein n=1 Tax=Methanosarcina hadiensis TaxID=3078083 RepID=UPI0039775190